MSITAKELLKKKLSEHEDLAPLDARILLLHALDISLVEFIAEPNQEVSREDADRFNGFVERRLRKEPVSQITQYKEFWSLSFFVNGDVLTPRPDSEALIELALEQFTPETPLEILDIGTGSGCLMAALLHEFPKARGVVLDKSEAALAVATRNFTQLGLEKRVEVQHGDFSKDLHGQFDLVISNPPYIAEEEGASLEADVRDYEPHMALFATGNGYDAYRIISPQLPQLLKENGCAIFEVGAEQAEKVSDMLLSVFMQASLHGKLIGKKDLAGIDRAVGFQLLEKNHL